MHRVGFEEVVLVAKDRELLDRVSQSPHDLGDENWVLFDPTHGLTEVIDLFCASLGIQPRGAARSAQVEAALTLSLDGVGITLLPENVVPLELRAEHTARAGPGVFRELVAYTRGQPSALANRYVELLLGLDLGLIRKGSLPPDAIVC